MHDWQKNLVRHMIQHVISTQQPDVYDFLRSKFLEATDGDEQDTMEMMDTWQKFEGWIAIHGLENTR